MNDYWGDKVVPEEDDFDLWIAGGDHEEEEIDPEEGVEIEEQLGELDELIEELGPHTVLEGVSQFMYEEMSRPFHRIAKATRDLAARTQRLLGAMEEIRQTKGGKK